WRLRISISSAHPQISDGFGISTDAFMIDHSNEQVYIPDDARCADHSPNPRDTGLPVDCSRRADVQVAGQVKCHSVSWVKVLTVKIKKLPPYIRWSASSFLS